MKIKKMTASFGGLKNETLSLGAGLNVITAPNERGKSTWCAFMKAMLFGIDSAQRAKGGVLPDKTHYAAWDGSPMAGEMDISWAGRDVTLTRRGKASAPMKDFTAVYTGTATPVPELTGLSAGEALTGVTRSVYESSAFIGQNGIRVTQGPELEKRIAAIASSGDEDVSFSETEKQLSAWQRRRRWRTSGELPEIEAQLEEKTRALDALKSASGEIDALESRVREQEARCDSLRKQVIASRKQARKDALTLSGTGRSALHEAENHAADARAAEKTLAERLDAGVFRRKTPEEVREEAEAVTEKSRALACAAAETPNSTLTTVLSLVSAVLAIAGLIFLFAVENTLACGIALIVVGLFVCIANIYLLRKNKQRTLAAAAAGEEREALLSDYGVSSEDALLASAQAHAAVYARWQEAAEALRQANAALQEAKARQEKLDAAVLSALDFASGDNASAALGKELQIAEAQAQHYREALASAKGRAGVMGDPLTLGSEIEELRHRHGVLQQEYDALTLALDTLRDADTEMRTRFSPQLSARAAELFARLTGGRYDRLTLDNALSAQARRSGDTLAHDAQYLSAGTNDQLYLALRLAICDLALPDGEAPLVLDDALCAFDDTRCRTALELLRELGEKRQILLFTCHSREKDMLSGTPGVNCVEL